MYDTRIEWVRLSIPTPAAAEVIQLETLFNEGYSMLTDHLMPEREHSYIFCILVKRVKVDEGEDNGK